MEKITLRVKFEGNDIMDLKEYIQAMKKNDMGGEIKVTVKSVMDFDEVITLAKKFEVACVVE